MSMSKKNKPDTRGFVFSTDPDFKFEEESISIININQQINGYRNHSNSAA